ncbi:MAG: M13 family metallopeptidase [Hyphomonadaceae bacterium]
MLSMTRRAMTASSIALFAAGATRAGAQQVGAPGIGSFGIDLTARDTNVHPGDDFARYCNGAWLDATDIPADRSRWGTFDMLIEKASRDVRTIVEEVALAGGAPGSNQRKIADFYTAFIDTDAIERAGLAPAQADLATLAAARTHEDLIRLIAAPGMPLASPIALYVTIDDRDPDRNVVRMTHSGLSLPDRDYYLRDDAEFSDVRSAYLAHVERMLTLGGQDGAAAKAQAIVAFETAIARLHWPAEDRRDVERTYNPQTRAQIRALAPAFPWDAAFDAAEMGAVQDVIVSELSAMGPLAELYVATPVDTIRAYLTYNYLNNMSAVLPRALDEENFAFYGRTLNGQPQMRERWKRGVSALNGAIGKAVGEIYVQRHFPPASKAQMLELVENLRRAYGERIDRLPWMTAETKIAAREKLATFLPKIGYPDSWRDYSALDIRAGDAFGNAKRTGEYYWRYDLGRLTRPTDKSEWLYMDPQEVNAYYNASFNEIVFPAAILQPPFFDPNADAAVNYGAIGGVIGHEMGHGFDDQGAKSDAHGVLRDWWSASDVAAFNALGDKLVAQYDAFSPLPGINVNGRLTLGENIGDNGGLQVAHYAYRLSLNGRQAPTLEGTSGDQRFFMGWGQAWRQKIRDQALRNQVVSDPHSPAIYRCNGPVRNMSAWYEAFDVQPSHALYLPPADRVEIW